MGDPAASRQGSGLYQYLPLDKGAGEIRLLYLLPGPFSSLIRVVLESTPFSPDTPLPAEDSSMAIDFFNTICSKITVAWQTYLLQPTSSDTGSGDMNITVPLDQA
jgi:hypothetical protein